MPVFVDYIEQNKNNDLIYWPCIHHSFGYGIINAEPVRGRMDWSNFALKAHIARKVGINHPTAYMADGLFIEEVIASNLVKKKIRIEKVLNVKN
jgi:AAA+ superfamily predicted ATPase